jgi:hypothetical protein
MVQAGKKQRSSIERTRGKEGSSNEPQGQNNNQVPMGLSTLARYKKGLTEGGMDSTHVTGGVGSSEGGERIGLGETIGREEASLAMMELGSGKFEEEGLGWEALNRCWWRREESRWAVEGGKERRGRLPRRADAKAREEERKGLEAEEVRRRRDMISSYTAYRDYQGSSFFWLNEQMGAKLKTVKYVRFRLRRRSPRPPKGCLRLNVHLLESDASSHRERHAPPCGDRIGSGLARLCGQAVERTRVERCRAIRGRFP